MGDFTGLTPPGGPRPNDVYPPIDGTEENAAILAAAANLAAATDLAVAAANQQNVTAAPAAPTGNTPAPPLDLENQPTADGALAAAADNQPSAEPEAAVAIDHQPSAALVQAAKDNQASVGLAEAAGKEDSIGLEAAAGAAAAAGNEASGCLGATAAAGNEAYGGLEAAAAAGNEASGGLGTSAAAGNEASGGLSPSSEYKSACSFCEAQRRKDAQREKSITPPSKFCLNLLSCFGRSPSKKGKKKDPSADYATETKTLDNDDQSPEAVADRAEELAALQEQLRNDPEGKKFGSPVKKAGAGAAVHHAVPAGVPVGPEGGDGGVQQAGQAAEQGVGGGGEQEGQAAEQEAGDGGVQQEGQVAEQGAGGGGEQGRQETEQGASGGAQPAVQATEQGTSSVTSKVISPEPFIGTRARWTCTDEKGPTDEQEKAPADEEKKGPTDEEKKDPTDS